MSCPVWTYPRVEAGGTFRGIFLGRCPETDVRCDKEEALARLEGVHRKAMTGAGLDPARLVTAEQVHGRDVRVAEIADKGTCLSGCDGLVTSEPGVLLGIYVADCAAVFVTDPQRRVAALLHSGKRGTESGILPRAVELLRREYGSDPGDLVVEVSPCIRPPHYDVDFAAQLERQAMESGVGRYHDEGRCTGSDLQKYYSYRIERGKTGRMLALLEILA